MLLVFMHSEYCVSTVQADAVLYADYQSGGHIMIEADLVYHMSLVHYYQVVDKY